MGPAGGLSRTRMVREKNECFRVLYLDTKNRLIEDEEQQRGTVNHADLSARGDEAGARAHRERRHLVHNHPSGDPSPSKADIEMTRRCATSGRASASCCTTT